MAKHFNTAGPCKPELHYMLPPGRRLDGVRDLIDRQSYFVVHAPRQVGKTTALLALARELTEAGRYAATLVSAEVGAVFEREPGKAEEAILSSWRRATEAWLPAELQPPPWPSAPAGARVEAALAAWSLACPRPLVLFIDEIDALRQHSLLSILRQLRAGYAQRPEAFPWSLALVGLRDVRDYKVESPAEGRLDVRDGSDEPVRRAIASRIKARRRGILPVFGGGATQSRGARAGEQAYHSRRGHLGTTSPFNIKVESITLRAFVEPEVAELYQQHTDDTGQPFTEDAVSHAFELTQGQPWLVNALARQCVEAIASDRRTPITREHMEHAKAQLIERQDTHLDSLMERLREPRVQRVLEPMLAGGGAPNVSPDDLRFLVDLGLMRRTQEGGLVIANPIYAEVIPTMLAYVTRAFLPQIQPTWLDAQKRLDPEALLDAFMAVWRQHAEPLLSATQYTEIAPHIVLMAFLHRVANGGGTLEREYAIGRGRMDLCLRYQGAVLALELKVWRDHEPDPKTKGLEQLDKYLAGLGLDRGWLVVFDRRTGQPPLAERTAKEDAQTPAGRSVSVIRA